ncbi:MAG: tRNA pseudouridine(38-40) synthase TruA [bacterium]
MKNYKIIVAYDGTRYKGWQKQGNTKETIQQKLQDVVSKMCGKEVEVFGSGRTDAGAHASYQVANFKAKVNLQEQEILEYINQYLPLDIAVTHIEVTGERFHSRLNAKNKTYVYRLNISSISNVFEKNFVYQKSINLDVEKMKEASVDLIGKHDFVAFSSGKKTKKSTIREIYSIEIVQENNEVKFIINGSGFLYNMVRIIVGTLIEIGEGSRQNDIKNILISKDRQKAGVTIPACGLCLQKVNY